HDEHNPALAYLIARLGPPDFPTPIGVFTAVDPPCYEDGVAAPGAAAQGKGKPDPRALFERRETWAGRQRGPERHVSGRGGRGGGGEGTVPGGPAVRRRAKPGRLASSAYDGDRPRLCDRATIRTALSCGSARDSTEPAHVGGGLAPTRACPHAALASPAAARR